MSGPRQQYSVILYVQKVNNEVVFDRFDTRTPKADLRAIATNGHFSKSGAWYPPHRVVGAEIHEMREDATS